MKCILCEKEVPEDDIEVRDGESCCCISCSNKLVGLNFEVLKLIMTNDL